VNFDVLGLQREGRKRDISLPKDARVPVRGMIPTTARLNQCAASGRTLLFTSVNTIPKSPHGADYWVFVKVLLIFAELSLPGLSG